MRTKPRYISFVFTLALSFGLILSAFAMVEPLPKQSWWPKKGTIILGGGYWSSEHFAGLTKSFVELAGGTSASIVVIPTANKELEPAIDSSSASVSLAEYQKSVAENFGGKLGVKDVVVLHTRDPKIADSEEFVAPLRKATGVWIPGGNPDSLAKPYRNTSTQRELAAILERGGVIAGDSAGAIVIGGFWTGFLRDSVQVPPLEENGFGLLKNIVVSAHVDRAKNDPSLARFISAHPEFLGISIDENTAVVIGKGALDVLGKGKMRIFDAEKDKQNPSLTLTAGEHHVLEN